MPVLEEQAEPEKQQQQQQQQQPQRKKKGFTFSQGAVAPKEIKELPSPQDELLETKPSSVTASSMFAPAKKVGKPKVNAKQTNMLKASALPRALALPKVALPKVALPLPKALPKVALPLPKVALPLPQVALPLPQVALPKAPAFAKPAAALAESSVAAAAASLEGADSEESASLEDAPDAAPAAPAAAPAAASETFTELDALSVKIIEEQSRNPYETEVPSFYVPETRRGFSEFIKETYATYVLPDGPVNVREGTIYYPYQAFVRDYMRQAAPYRGLLVYHGLGSGKTCSAIAAAEALFSTSNKKIIVMTPFSLRKNFLEEVMFCGFRHFQLQNFWVSMDTNDATVALFAQETLGISAEYLKSVSRVWVPDFNKTREEANYTTLDADEQLEIRKQILSVIEYNPKKGTGRIHFINYNGISAKKLLALACEPNSPFFDNSVIVIDEIHNLIRLMQGTIDPYLTTLKGHRRLIPLEPVTPQKWKPLLCQNTKTYGRGYLFYRLLLGAQNSKIIGLSGTPLINFPEELGILANVLHGYITTVEGIVEATGAAVQAEIEGIGQEHPHIDFVKATQDPAGGGTKLLMTVLPMGIRKLGHEEGVHRIPLDEKIPTLDEILETLKLEFVSKKLVLKGELQAASVPLLPPTAEQFQETFVNKNTLNKDDLVKNWQVLLTRMTGLVSFYKGSRQDLMPRIKEDTVVRVPMSSFSQKVYAEARKGEAAQEMKPKEGGASYGAIWTQVFEIGVKAQTNNYKMASRQASNFTFPSDVVRPKPRSKEELNAEAGAGEIATELDVVVDEPETEKGEPFPELEAEVSKEEEADAAEAAVEEEIKATEGEGEEQVAAAVVPKPKAAAAPVAPAAPVPKPAPKPAPKAAPKAASKAASKASIRIPSAAEAAALAEIAAIDKRVKDKQAAKKAAKAAGLKPKRFDDKEEAQKGGVTPEEEEEEEEEEESLAEELLEDVTTTTKAVLPNPIGAAEKAAEQIVGIAQPKKGSVAAIFEARRAECKAGQQAGEKLSIAYDRAKQCLKTISKASMKLGGENGLETHSPKFASMLDHIKAAAGSSLVYSQFLEMEGIGIFRVAMEVNGYASIDIQHVGGSLTFSEATKKSLKERPDQPRFITFSGDQDEDVRRMNLQVFNARLDKLSAPLQEFLATCVDGEGRPRYTDNKLGQLCRVICITSAGAEGLSLKNVRAVHIMEPYWNNVRLKQVKGRAIRIGSHLELPEDQRDVSIYTYISVYKDEAQTLRSGEDMIDITIRNVDTILAKDAIALGVPVPAGLTEYVMTTDERIWIISEKKRQLIEKLESYMKSASIDCELNYKQNKDGTFKCLPLKGSIGDFVYHPLLEKDIQEAAKFVMQKPTPRVLRQAFKGVTYRMREVLDEENAVTGFEIFADDDDDMKVLKGRSKAAVKDGVWKPAPPVTWEGEKPVVAAAAAEEAKPEVKPEVKLKTRMEPKIIRQVFKGVTYKMREVLEGGTVTGFEIFAEDDTKMETLRGRSKAAIKDGFWKPAPPVTWV